MIDNSDLLFFKDSKNLPVSIDFIDEKVFFSFKSPFFFNEVSSFLLFFFNRFGYFSRFIDYEIRFIEKDFLINSEILKNFFLFIIESPFFWTNKEDFSFFLEKNDIIIDFSFINSIVYFYDESGDLERWKKKINSFKKILKKIGLPIIKFVLKRKREIDNKNLFKKNQFSNFEKKSITARNKHLIDDSIFKNEKIDIKTLDFNNLVNIWKDRKIFDFSVHTKFSTLDGVNSVYEYIKDAKSKNYHSIAITDHYNIQSFPDISKFSPGNDLKILYGCEFDMLEDKYPSYIFKGNGNDYDYSFEKDSIYDLKYCIFDLETTGFFSDYDEIIEIGYIIYDLKENKILKEVEHFIKPKIINEDIFPHWFSEDNIKKIKDGKMIEEILPILKEDWKDCVLVAHNAKNFDFGFIRKAWNNFFDSEIDNLIVDTLPLSWIFFPKKKSYSLEKLSQNSKKEKNIQTHHSLDDSKMLLVLFLKIVKLFEEDNFVYWGEIEKKINKDYYFNYGKRIKVLVKNKEGLKNLYRLITISHTKNLFRNPCVFRSDLKKYRSGLIIGSSGSLDSEIFSFFSSYESLEDRGEKINFYDFIELGNPNSFNYLFMNKKIKRVEIENMFKIIINQCKKMNKLFICSNNVHYCNEEDKIIKKILISNEGINGKRHYLYNEVLSLNKKIMFDYIPNQHLLNIDELVKEWVFLNNSSLIEEIIFSNFETIENDIEDIDIFPDKKSLNEIEKFLKNNDKEKEIELTSFFNNKVKLLFGNKVPHFVKDRINEEWKIIKEKNYISIYWLAYKVVQKTISDGYIVGSRGTIGASFIAFLCDITELNPLPLYKYCKNCFYLEIIGDDEKKEKDIKSCYDYIDYSYDCPSCKNFNLSIEGNDLPFESFFGLQGEKTPDIDLNFSGKYQKTIHNYVRDLLGNDSVFRIGTISTLSEQTAKIFYDEYGRMSSH